MKYYQPRQNISFAACPFSLFSMPAYLLNRFSLTICFRFCFVFFSFLFLVLSQALAQHQPAVGANQFPQYRQISGLAGGGYGLDQTGRSSLSGPTAFSTPIAYVLGHDEFRLGVSSESFDSAPNWGANHANGKGLVSYGHTFGQFNIMATDLFKSHTLDQAYNLQVGIIPLRNQQPGFSLGIQDITGTGGSAGEGLPTDRHSSQSVFAVTTYRIATRRRPIYVTAGIGTHRFAKAFASASYQFLKPLRGWIEQDGWGFNEGILLTGRTGRGRTSTEFSANVGLIRGRYFTFAVGIGF